MNYLSNMKTVSLFKNTKKSSDKHPDYIVTGKVGEEYKDIGAAWVKKTKPSEKNPEGKTYLSITFKDGYEVRKDNLTSAGTPVPFPDDVPF